MKQKKGDLPYNSMIQDVFPGIVNDFCDISMKVSVKTSFFRGIALIENLSRTSTKRLVAMD
jgi:hypothetical protein